jgi:hypothetical protein
LSTSIESVLRVSFLRRRPPYGFYLPTSLSIVYIPIEVLFVCRLQHKSTAFRTVDCRLLSFCRLLFVPLSTRTKMVVLSWSSWHQVSHQVGHRVVIAVYQKFIIVSYYQIAKFIHRVVVIRWRIPSFPSYLPDTSNCHRHLSLFVYQSSPSHRDGQMCIPGLSS